MNLKPNLWTLLFAIAVITLLVQHFGNEKNTSSLSLTDFCSSVPYPSPHEIPAKEAQSRMINYARYVAAIHVKYDSLAQDVGIVEPVVSYYYIPKGDLKEAYCAFPDVDVYATMTIKPGPAGQGLDTLDLMFTDIQPPSPGIPFGNPTPSAKYFDFTRPCPPVCPD